MTAMDTDTGTGVERAKERLVVGPRTLALLAEAMFGAPAVPALLDAFVEGAGMGADRSRRWTLVLTGAEIVRASPEQEQGEGAGAVTAAPAPEHTAENPS